jgi:3-hydroxyacyl-CoA dehydrogenase / enoyl-CoA hydratase / 3-hydroxybutyryl-CoA epimerase
MPDRNQAALDALAMPRLAMPEAAPDQPSFATYAHWRLVLDRDNALWAILDKKDASTNTLSEAVLRELAALLDEARAAAPDVLVIRSAKPNGFIAGADIGELAGMTDAAVIEDKIGAGLAVLDALEAFPRPTVALIHGFCLGGGLELALACRYRVATPDAKLGFPEVMLGLFPGLGGTWRSLSRMKPVDAMTAMLTGRSIIARKAKAQGLVDAVSEERHFAEAVRWAAAGKLTASKPKGLIDRAMTLPPLRRLIATRMEREAAKKAPRVHYPAPHVLIDLWREHGDNAAGWRADETGEFAKLLQGGTSRNLVRCFFLREKLKSLAKGHDHGIRHVHVVGAGVMGGDIAALCALRGFRVSLQDRNIGLIAPAMKRADRMFARRLFAEGDRRAALDRLMPDAQGIGLAKADLVIEAVPEDLEIKQAVYRACEAGMRADAILASNTSSILIEALHQGLQAPERFCGIHFFNPVDHMPLVELVTHDGLGASVRGRALAFIEAIDKLPLPVTSSPGFLVNRALTPYIVEAFVVHSEGVKPEVIDTAAEAFGMPMGPIELADTVGLDVGLHVATCSGAISRSGHCPTCPAGLRGWSRRASSARRPARAFTGGKTASRTRQRSASRQIPSCRTGSSCRCSMRSPIVSATASLQTPMRPMPAWCSAPALRRSGAARSTMPRLAASPKCPTPCVSSKRATGPALLRAPAGRRCEESPFWSALLLQPDEKLLVERGINRQAQSPALGRCRGAGARPDDPIDRPDIVAALCEQPLQVAHLPRRETSGGHPGRRLAALPARPGQPVGEQSDRPLIDRRLVPFVQNLEVMRALVPRLARPPAVGAQVVGGGREHVGDAADQVAPAVAIEVDGEALVVGSEELGLADLAGPGAAHLRGAQVAAVDDPQRRHQLVLEHLGAPAVIGERRQRADDRHSAGIGAEVALKPPDRHQDRPRHAVLPLDAGQQVGVAAQHLGARLIRGVTRWRTHSSKLRRKARWSRSSEITWRFSVTPSRAAETVRWEMPLATAWRLKLSSQAGKPPGGWHCTWACAAPANNASDEARNSAAHRAVSLCILLPFLAECPSRAVRGRIHRPPILPTRINSNRAESGRIQCFLENQALDSWRSGEGQARRQSCL